MKKLSRPALGVIIFVVVAIILLGVLFGYILRSRNESVIQINPNICVKDSADMKELKSYSSKDVKFIIQESVENIVSKEFNKTVNYLNLTIGFFSLFLTVIIVVFGYYTIKKMSEAKDLLDEILRAPDSVMKKYYDNQLNELIPKLMSSKPMEKLDAIKKINLNTQLVPEKHYDILSNVLKLEFQKITSYTLYNVIYLYEPLLSLDYRKTIDLGFDVFNENYSHRSMEFIIPHLIESKDKIHVNKILGILCDTTNPARTSTFINNIDHYGMFDIEMITYLAENAPQNITYQIINHIIREKRIVDLKPVIKKFKPEFFNYSQFHQIFNLLVQNKQLDIDLILFILERTIENKFDVDQVVQLLMQVSHQIQNDDELIKIITTLEEKFVSINSFTQIYERLNNDPSRGRFKNIIEQIQKRKE